MDDVPLNDVYLSDCAVILDGNPIVATSESSEEEGLEVQAEAEPEAVAEPEEDLGLSDRVRGGSEDMEPEPETAEPEPETPEPDLSRGIDTLD